LCERIRVLVPNPLRARDLGLVYRVRLCAVTVEAEHFAVREGVTSIDRIWYDVIVLRAIARSDLHAAALALSLGTGECLDLGFARELLALPHAHHHAIALTASTATMTALTPSCLRVRQ